MCLSENKQGQHFRTSCHDLGLELTLPDLLQQVHQDIKMSTHRPHVTFNKLIFKWEVLRTRSPSNKVNLFTLSSAYCVHFDLVTIRLISCVDWTWKKAIYLQRIKSTIYNPMSFNLYSIKKSIYIHLWNGYYTSKTLKYKSKVKLPFITVISL